MVIISIQEIVGRFHPLLVHLPIGILLIAAFFHFLSRNEKYTSLKTATGITLFWGMISAVASCISGYLLSISDDYDVSLIGKHQWFGIGVAAASILAYYLFKKNNRQTKWIVALMVPLIAITGHLGGSITHGSDYLTKAFSGSSDGNTDAKRKPVPNVQEALVYADVIKPILETRCAGCHGANKQKGKLRLDEPDFIINGGKDGKVIIPGKADESNLIERILLAKENDDHMPPKEKPQLSKQDIDLLHWWVSSGADFTKKVKDVPQTEKIKPVLLALQSGETKEEIKTVDIPEKNVDKADDKILKKLADRGVAIVPVAQNSHYLSANFVAVDSLLSADLDLLQQIKNQLIWLKLSSIKMTDADLNAVSKLTSLTRLSLDKTAVTDAGLASVKNIPQLSYLNLARTKVTAKGLEQLKDLKQLQKLYLYQAAVTGADLVNLKRTFSKTLIDTGNYKVAFLESDTTVLTAPQKLQQQ